MRYFQSVYSISNIIKALKASVVTSPLCARKVGQKAVSPIENKPALGPYNSLDHLKTISSVHNENRKVTYLPALASSPPLSVFFKPGFNICCTALGIAFNVEMGILLSSNVHDTLYGLFLRILAPYVKWAVSSAVRSSVAINVNSTMAYKMRMLAKMILKTVFLSKRIFLKYYINKGLKNCNIILPHSPTLPLFYQVRLKA